MGVSSDTIRKQSSLGGTFYPNVSKIIIFNSASLSTGED